MDFKNIRIVAFDLDGTILDSKKRLSDRNREALAAAAEKGIVMVPTTGRMFDMIPPAIRELPFIRYAITINGAQVYDREAGDSIVREEIPIPTAVKVMELLDRYDVFYDCYRLGRGWVTAAMKPRAVDYATDDHYLRLINDFMEPVGELKAHLLSTAAAGDVQKIMLFSSLKDASCLKAIRAEMAERFAEIRITSSCWNNLEFNIADANKGNILRRFAEKLGYTLDNCLALGDGLNDLSMIEAAGVGVAMANAVDEVRKAADLITLTNDEDGVAQVLERLAL